MSSQTGTELSAEYDRLNVGIALYDPDTGRIADANDRLESVLGYTTGQLRTLSVDRYTANTYPHSGAAFRERVRASADGDPQEFRWRIKRADGELIWVQVHLSRRDPSGGPRVLAEIRDITDYYETHHRAELFWRLLRHNLRNELTVILGNADRIGAETESDDVTEAVATIRRRTENLENVTNSVKEIEAAVASTDSQRIRRAASDAVREVIAQVEQEYPAGDITLDIRSPMGINVDGAFTYALTHALENAVVHSEETTPTVEVSIGPSPNTGRVEICIRDSNPPIPDDELDALFSPTGKTSTSHGSGVGLFVMKWCVESLGGEIKFETRTGGGNAVYFYLPPKRLPGQSGEEP